MISASILAVMAHPDDEALGCGATLAWYAQRGSAVHACFLSGAAEARSGHPGAEELRSHTLAAQRALGIGDPQMGPFPNLSLNTVPHIELVQYIEKVMIHVGATVLLTHHPSDANDDHRQTSLACRAASRLSQRGSDVPELEALYFVEVLSSTDWSLDPGAQQFSPTTYVEIGEDGLDRKLRALREYPGVMRPYPHPRSEEAIRALATVRGAESGLDLAEAFQLAYARLVCT